ncbi:PLP-dependent aminotransferase family protein [Achromobacter sp. NPDC058515]|uniref:aminotransferase-like domain-containing protein n=1 Tax=Achromobacter sp. NPDC058515 TaxID=3346533 RepID=UPI003668ED5D
MQSSTDWVPDLSAAKGPMYKRIAQALVQDIRSGKLKPGDQLPPNRQLSSQLGVTVGTVSRAFGEVVRAKLLETGARRGTRVKDPAAADAVEAAAGVATIRNRMADLRGHQAALKSWGDDIGQALSLLHHSPAFGELLRYDDPAGRASHRQAGAQWLSRNTDTPVDPARVIVTDGAQHALLCGLMACSVAGDHIATEKLTYTGLRTLAPRLGLKLVPIEIDEHGLVPDSLREAIATHPIKGLVCVPNIHNPTTATIPQDRRIEIADIAKQAGIFLIEDDVYGCLAETRLPTLASLAPELTIRITSLSKCLGPGLRVGFVETPRQLTAAVTEAVRATTWMASPISAEVAAQLVTSGRAEHVLQENRLELAERNDALAQALTGFDLRTSAFSPHAWLRLPDPWTASQFCRRIETMGYQVSPSEAFAAGLLGMDNGVRISVSAAQDAAELQSFGLLIARMLAEEPHPPSIGIFP